LTQPARFNPDAVERLAEFMECVAASPEQAVKEVPSRPESEKVVLFRKPEVESVPEEAPGPLADTDLHAARRTGDEELLPETWELIRKAQEEVRRKHGGPNRRGTSLEGEEK
jgi:hypothetical protein